jgi:SAM-dependent methyltransferase
MDAADWASDIDVERPSPARMYDYFLGGAHNFAADRQVAEQVIAVFPEVMQGAQVNRAFLRRTVEFLVGAGVRQFLDIGSGIPTVGHVHEIAQGLAPESRVAFVDVDPVAVAHSRAILAGNDRTEVIQEDVRRPDRIMRHPDLLRLLDMDQPVAVLMVALLHFISDAEQPAQILSQLMDPLVSGSYLAITHATNDGTPDMDQMKDIYRGSGIELTWRTHQQMHALFDGYDLVDPGVVWAPLWHPESPDDIHHDQPEVSANYGGVARKP